MESACRRAWGDTERFRHTAGSFWWLEIVGASVLGLGGGYAGFLLTPENATPKQNFIYPAIGGVVGVIVGLVIVFLLIYTWNLFRAPYRQRNEARTEAERVQNELDHIKNARPQIGVRPKIDNDRDRFILEVHNYGKAEAYFTAKARVIKGRPGQTLYNMYWEGKRETECRINAGDTWPILVGEKSHKIIPSRNLYDFVYEGDLLLFMVGTSGEQAFPVHKVLEKGVVIDGRAGVEIISENKCVIEVTITSAPPLVEEFGTHQYALEIGDNKLVFTDLLVNDKGGSQTQ